MEGNPWLLPPCSSPDGPIFICYGAPWLQGQPYTSHQALLQCHYTDLIFWKQDFYLSLLCKPSNSLCAKLQEHDTLSRAATNPQVIPSNQKCSSGFSLFNPRPTIREHQAAAVGCRRPQKQPKAMTSDTWKAEPYENTKDQIPQKAAGGTKRKRK